MTMALSLLTVILEMLKKKTSLVVFSIKNLNVTREKNILKYTTHYQEKMVYTSYLIFRRKRYRRPPNIFSSLISEFKN